MRPNLKIDKQVEYCYTHYSLAKKNIVVKSPTGWRGSRLAQNRFFIKYHFAFYYTDHGVHWFAQATDLLLVRANVHVAVFSLSRYTYWKKSPQPLSQSVNKINTIKNAGEQIREVGYRRNVSSSIVFSVALIQQCDSCDRGHCSFNICNMPGYWSNTPQ